MLNFRGVSLAFRNAVLFFDVPKLRLPKFGSDQSDSVGSCYTGIDVPYLHLDAFMSHFFRNLIDLSGRLMLHVTCSNSGDYGMNG